MLLASIGLFNHLCASPGTTLNAYPQWYRSFRSIPTIDSNNLAPETTSFPAHAKRYGRVYVNYRIITDPEVGFVEATSTATVDSLYNVDFAKRRPNRNGQEGEVTLTQFVPPTAVANALGINGKDTDDLYKPIMAVQCTQLACGGIALVAKIAHSLADITAITCSVRDWASVSCAMLKEVPLPALKPVLEPLRLDGCAAGDINADDANSSIMKDELGLLLHSHGWWAPPGKPPLRFPLDLSLTGKPLP